MDLLPEFTFLRVPDGMPIGCIVAYRPSFVRPGDDDKVFGSNMLEVTGKIHDQLYLMQLNGPKCPLVILTSWNKWQLLSHI